MDHHPLRLPGQWFKGNLHAHTRHSDGELTLEEAVRWHQEHAYDFLAVTDHRVVTDTRNFTRPGFLTIPGIEVNTGRTELGMDYHFIALGIEKYSTLPNTMSVQETIDELVVHGAIVPDLCRSLSYGPIPTPLLHLHCSGHVRAAKEVIK